MPAVGCGRCRAEQTELNKSAVFIYLVYFLLPKYLTNRTSVMEDVLGRQREYMSQKPEAYEEAQIQYRTRKPDWV